MVQTWSLLSFHDVLFEFALLLAIFHSMPPSAALSAMNGVQKGKGNTGEPATLGF